MIKYIEITIYDYLDLKDQSGYYCVRYSDMSFRYFKNDCLHKEDGPAITHSNGNKYYYFNDHFYGNKDDYTDESWSRFCKLKAFI